MTDVPVTLPTSRSCPFDPPAELGRLREQGPLRRLAYPDGHVGWLVTDYALARAVLADSRFSARSDVRRVPIHRPAVDSVVGKPPPPGLFVVMDPPEHTRYRRLLTAQFTVRRLKQLEPRIARIVDEHLDALREAGPPADLVSTFALPVPSLVICELLGVPYADRAQFQGFSAVLARLATSAEEAAEASKSLDAFMRDLIRRKRAQPGDDLLSGLITGGELTEEEMANIAILLLVAGHDTTANMLALGTFALLQHPAQAAAMRADQSAVDNAVEELLRYLTIVQFGAVRAALENIELGGRLVKAGESVTISVSAANRDPARFDNPETLDITRPATGHLAFGHGVHQCLGQQLARIEMRIGYAALFRRFPALRLAVAPEEVPMREGMNIYGVDRLPVAW
jgi:cytochrome P450